MPRTDPEVEFTCNECGKKYPVNYPFDFLGALCLEDFEEEILASGWIKNRSRHGDSYRCEECTINKRKENKK